MHATALSFPGAAYHRPADLHPPRLDIALPRALGSRLATDAAASVRMGMMQGAIGADAVRR